MTRTLRYLLLFVFTALSGSAIAQEISGRVLDDKKEPLPSAVVQVYSGGIYKGGNVTDYDGNYTIKPLDPGSYDVLVIYQGFDSIEITGVSVSPNLGTNQNFQMTRHTNVVKGEFIIKAYKKPLVDQEKPDAHILTKSEIDVIPTTQVSDIVSTTPGVYQQQRGANVSMGGARNTGTQYIIDGVYVQLNNGIDMSQGSMDQIEVITSGIPANYGDVSGGVVNITSRGVAQKFTGDVRVQHSIDGYNNNLVNFSVAGPIYKKTVRQGDHTSKKPVLGFALSGDFYYDNDRYPTYNEQYAATGSVLSNLQKNPLTLVTNSSGATTPQLSSDFITYSDLTQTKIPPKNLTKEARLNGKLDYQLTDNMHVVAGGMFDYTSADAYNRNTVLFAPGAVPIDNTINGRGFIRFTQKFGKMGDTSSRHSIISNAYYSIQGDFQKLNEVVEDPTFKSNIFDYGYVGNFTENKSKVYTPLQTDSASGRQGTVLAFDQVNSITFTPGNLNPGLANYTSQFYNQYVNPSGVPITNLTQIQAFYGILNGDQPAQTYGLFASPGTTQSYYYKTNSNQYSLDVNASFDLLTGKTKHAIQFGLYYQQRIEETYYAYSNLTGQGTVSLWQLMRGLVSSVDNGNLVLDKKNPMFLVNGKEYTLAQVQSGAVIPGPNDTILYNYINVNTDKTFDNNLRKKLGLADNADINIDALNPSVFSLSMFSADELLNSGSSFVSYQGYTYTGAAQPTNVNFNDFWTAKDANGNYTRPIGAFTPNYIAGYLLDNFNYKDVHFNIGVRVDRYSANTKVLIDPYSLYAEKTVNQVPGSENIINGGQHPSNIPGNYVVYVDDNTSSSPSIIGYRSGDNWYDPTGKFIADPSVLKQYSGGRDPQPALVNDSANIKSNNFNPNQSFTDYTPQVNVQPRVSFSFPISDVANFYGHYDIYSRRPYPTAYGEANAETYYYLQNSGNNYIPNANLKPEETIDYEVGFQEKLSDHSALQLNAFYKERKDMITAVPYEYAWPITYYTYGNRDFSTTKGTSLFYDLRATNHLRMTVSYTLQFAEGTGSSPTSRNSILQNFVEAGLPNERYITALDYDSRHNIAANIDYRYLQGEGPIIGGKNVFQNAGIDLIARARSGEPYTAYSEPPPTPYATSNTVIGGVNGSRLPWHYGLDLRIDKDFSLTNSLGKKHSDAIAGVKPKRPLFLKAILQINNVLQTKDILSVYGFTGRPDDNGYLTSAFGRQYVPQQVNPQSFTDLYQINYNNPGNLNYARTISFALEFNF